MDAKETCRYSNKQRKLWVKCGQVMPELTCGGYDVMNENLNVSCMSKSYNLILPILDFIILEINCKPNWKLQTGDL